MFTKPARGWIIFAQIFGTVLSVVALIAVAAEWDAIINAMGTQMNATAMTVASLIVALLSYVIIKQIINMSVIINSMQKMDDFTLSANRWIISSLSLTVGGFFTPFIMTMFPNVNAKSTINPKVFLAKVYGWTFLIGGAAFVAIFGGVANSNLTGSDVAKKLTIAFMVIGGFLTVLGLVLTILFSRKDASSIYESNTSLSKAMKVFANINAAFVTVELVLMLVWNWVEVISSVWEAFGSSNNSNGSVNPFMIILAIFNLIIGLVYVGYLTHITNQTLKGLWNGQPDYTVFEPLQKQQGQPKPTL